MSNKILRTPQEILFDADSKRNQLLSKIKSQAIDEIERTFIGEDLTFWIDGNKSQVEPLMIELEKEFANRGWRLKIADSFSSQKDGDRIRFFVGAF